MSLKPLFFLLFFISYSIHISAGETPRIIYSPSNPTAGQTVTFTVENSTYPSYCVKEITPDLANLPGTRVEVSDMSNAATYTYTSPGTYEIAYDVSCEEGLNRKPSDRSVLFFQLGPVGGPFVNSTPMTNGISAAQLVIGARPAAIPTMSEWGLIILALLSLIFGVVMINQKYFVTAK